MALYVIKFGGTSLADANCFRNAAKIVQDLVDNQHHVVAVVSAMAGETDRLVSLATELQSSANNSDNFDVIVSSGEHSSSVLFSLALNECGIEAKPFQGWQLPILTSNSHSKAQIEHIETSKLTTCLDSGQVAIVSGFQGVTSTGEITTFGRGGSDVTAVLLAAALNADECRLYKDVDGLFSADPKLVENPIILDQIGISELLEQCSQGAEIIHPRAVQAALKHDVPLRITPTFGQGQSGTLITPEKDKLESSSVSGIVCNDHEVRFVIPSIKTGTGLMSLIFSQLANCKIAVDMVLCDDDSHNSQTLKSLTFTVPERDAQETEKVLETVLPKPSLSQMIRQDRIAKIAVIGSGIKTHADIIAQVYDTVNELGITAYGLTASELKINLLVSQDYAKACTQALHKAFFENALSPRSSVITSSGKDH